MALIVVCCLLFAVHCVLFDVRGLFMVCCCALFVAGCLLSVVCLLFVVWCVLRVLICLLFVVVGRCVRFVACSSLLVVWCVC